jgi:hypothetical protein
MKEEYDQALEHLFHATYVDSPEEEFTRSVMDHVRRYERRSVVLRNVTGLSLLVIAWLLAPYIRNSALPISVFPGEAALSLATELAFAQSPLLFILGLAAAGYVLLNSRS